MQTSQEEFEGLVQSWEKIAASSSFDVDEVKKFRETLASSHGRIWVDDAYDKGLGKIYQTLNSDSLMHLIDNKCDDLSYLYENRNVLGLSQTPNRIKLVQHILDSNPSVDLLVSMFYDEDYETEDLARQAAEMMIKGGVEDFVLRWMISYYGSGNRPRAAGISRPSKEYASWLRDRVAKELLLRETTRNDLLDIIKKVPSFESEAWEQLQQRGFLIGTLTQMVRTLPDPYAQFAWEKILEHDATPKRMAKIAAGSWNTRSGKPKHVVEAENWLEKHAGE